MAILPKSFYARQPDTVAENLLGHILVVCRDRCLRCRIVEVEAYFGECDPASRARRGRGRLWRALYGDVGLTLIYGIHKQWLLNITAHDNGMAGAVLLRACEPLEGYSIAGRTNGPGRLTRALRVDKSLDGIPVYRHDSPIRVEAGWRPRMILRAHRIGVSEDLEIPLRFYDASSAYVSRRGAGGR